MARYIFEENADDQELRRLRLIEEALDQASIALLRSTGIQEGWRCLELGAGSGSIARWLGGIIGKSGQVVGIDIKTKYLQELSDAGPPHKIIQGDFLEVAIDDEFDLIH